jgi:hypothetical protein
MRAGLTRCWVWIAGRTKAGYGVFRRFPGSRRPSYAHRLSWAIANGHEPIGQVLHHCDNPSCVNPEHLYVGTQQDNVNDMLSRGRARVVGGANWNAKLTVTIVREIRSRRASGESYSAIARSYGLPRKTVSNAGNGKKWGHVQ